MLNNHIIKIGFEREKPKNNYVDKSIKRMNFLVVYYLYVTHGLYNKITSSSFTRILSKSSNSFAPNLTSLFSN